LNKAAKFCPNGGSKRDVQSIQKESLRNRQFYQVSDSRGKKGRHRWNTDKKRSMLLRGGQGIYLGNVFNDYRHAGAEQKKQILRNTLALFREKREAISFETAKSKLVAALRERALFAFTTLLRELEGGKG
jgi:hypothetical protein